MKRILAIAIILLLISAPGMAQMKGPLELKLVKDSTYKQKMSNSSVINQTVNGQETNITMRLSGEILYKVINILDSAYDLEVKYDCLEMRIESPIETKAFSSEKDDKTDLISRAFSAMKKNSFNITMAKTGKILAITNIDNLFKAFDEFSDLSEMQKKQIKTQLSQSYGEKAFRGNLESGTVIFPSTSVGKGDKWTIKGKLESGMIANIETIYELKDIEADQYIISGTSAIKSTDDGIYQEVNGVPTRYQLTGTMISDIIINKKTGWIIKSNVEQNINGMLEIKDNPAVPGGITVPMTMHNIMNISDK